MGFVDSVSKSSINLKIAAILSILAVAFAWTSFVTAAWGQDTNNAGLLNGWGLFKLCDNTETGPATCVKTFGWNLQWYRAVQAFAIMAFVSVNLCFFLILLLMFMASCVNGKSPTIWASILALWSTVCYIIAISIFGGKFDSDVYRPGATGGRLDYGWYLALTTLNLQIGVAINMILESRNVGAKVMDI